MRARSKEPRIVNPQTHPRRYVSLAVAADFLEVDRQTLNKWLTAGLLAYQDYGTRHPPAVPRALSGDRETMSEQVDIQAALQALADEMLSFKMTVLEFADGRKVATCVVPPEVIERWTNRLTEIAGMVSHVPPQAETL